MMKSVLALIGVAISTASAGSYTPKTLMGMTKTPNMKNDYWMQI